MSEVKELNSKMLFLTIVSIQHVEPQVKSSVLHWTFSSKLYPVQATYTHTAYIWVDPRGLTRSA